MCFCVHCGEVAGDVTFPLVLFYTCLVLCATRCEKCFFVRRGRISSFRACECVGGFFCLVPLMFVSLEYGFVERVGLVTYVMLAVSLFGACSLQLGVSRARCQSQFCRTRAIHSCVRTGSAGDMLVYRGVLLCRGVYSSGFSMYSVELCSGLSGGRRASCCVLLSSLGCLGRECSLGVSLRSICPMVDLKRQGCLCGYGWFGVRRVVGLCLWTFRGFEKKFARCFRVSPPSVFVQLQLW